MLLRRITKHVKEQNWFAVSIDFFIVVIGVFIGIQVANWNEGQADQRRANDLVGRMISEAEETQEQLTDYIIVHKLIKNNAEQLTLALKNKDTCIAMSDKLKILIVSIADFPPPRFSLSNAEQAVNTGNLSLIQSPSVRASIQTITNEMRFIDRQWQRYVRVKQDTNEAAHRASGVAFTGQGTINWVDSDSYDPNQYELLTPAKICGNTELIGLTSNLAVLQSIYVSYLGQFKSALNTYLTALSQDII
ncbi:hypothetical protein [Glaciecola petra]|uniref:Uncharacterized protein n=1 Tax=Glaciecola petra TaxID=3075602 RepID=A0ABU2ZT92_9ALTE|nr:hypothetical protein [Aestuariibacter sp. P117]MDT0595253.1 hypothetical protein [Aestuariibacter sp. P117]